MSITNQTIADLVSRIRKSKGTGEFEKLLVIVSDELGLDSMGQAAIDLEADLDEAIFGAKDDAEAIANVQDLVESVPDEEQVMSYPLDESTKRVTESSDIKEMVQAYLADDDPMILDSIIVQTVEDACDDARSTYGYDMSDAEIDNIADFVEFTVTVGKKRNASADEITSKITSYLSDNEEIANSLEEAVAWKAGRRLQEITGASYARDYLAQVDDPTDVTYEDYLSWLEDQGVPEQKISKVWFSTNKKKHIAKLADTPKESPDPKSKFGRAIAKQRGYKLSDEPKAEPKSEPPKPKPEPTAEKGETFTLADQKAVEDIIRREGYRLETMWGEDHPVSLRQSKTRDGKPFSILDAYIETGDRGPRMDHGGESGDGWMGSAEIEREFSPYGKKWAPRAKALEDKLRKSGYPTATVGVDYGEKGHIGLTVFISSSNPRQQESTGAGFGPMGSPARGAYEEPVRRNSSGWEKHPDELDYEDDDFFDDDFFDDDIDPAIDTEYDIDDSDDLYDDVDEGDQWMPESKLSESARNEILDIYHTLVDDEGYDPEVAKEVVAANFTDIVNGDEIYDILYGDMEYEDDDIEEDEDSLFQVKKKQSALTGALFMY